jgi:hypothetical protein
MTVFTKIHAVMADLSQDGIHKAQTNTFDKYQFRGIDDVYNALSGLLTKHHLLVLPQVKGFSSEQGVTSQGKPTIMTQVTVDYVLVDTEDGAAGSTFTCTVVGEGQDRGDKGMNKAMSAAYKLFCFQAFCIPTESGSNDSEQESETFTATGKVKLLGSDEMVQLSAILLETGTDVEAFCDWKQVSSMADLPLDQFGPTMAAMNRKKDRMAQEYEAEQVATALSQKGETS